MGTMAGAASNDDVIRAAFERCPCGLIVVDESGHIRVVNREIERQFGYAREELLGQLVEMLVPDNFAKDHPSSRAQYTAMPTARPMGAGRELFGRHKDGHPIAVEIGLSTISTPSGPCVLATVADVTERRRLENRLRQLHKLEALGNLASGIAHDFNNILLGIIGYTELARGAVSDPAVIADLDVVLDSTRRGRDLVNRILLFARTSEPIRIPTDFETIVREVVQLLRATLPSNIEIRSGFDSDTPRVSADSNELHQVALNLATNAVYAMKKQGGVLELHLGPVSVDSAFVKDHLGTKAGLHVRLSISDTGSGIPPGTVDHIFEPFFTTKPAGEGTGLGLSIIDRIVRSMRGTIEVKSRVGEGTRFDVYVPAAPTDESRVPPRTPGNPGCRRIMLVDDEESLARLGQRLLQSAGFEVVVFTSSLQALESVRANPERFDLLITDNTMPHMTGLELVARVIGIRPSMPVLMVSGVGESTPLDTLKKLGVSRVLSKPYDSADLKAAVKELLEVAN